MIMKYKILTIQLLKLLAPINYFCDSNNILEYFRKTMASILIYLSRKLRHMIFYVISKMFRSKQDMLAAALSMCQAITENNNVKCISLIHTYPECINTEIGPDGYTPFLMACLHGNTQIAKLMLNLGADVKQKTKNDESAFYLATFCNVKDYFDRNVSCLNMLYYAGADMDAPTQKGLRPIQMAAMFGKTNLVKWLLMKGANPSVSPHPYILATSQGFQSTANTLMEWQRTNSLSLAIRDSPNSSIE